MVFTDHLTSKNNTPRTPTQTCDYVSPEHNRPLLAATRTGGRMTQPALLTATEAAARLGISRWRLYNRIHVGDIQARTTRKGEYVITEEAIQEFLNNGGVDFQQNTEREWISTKEAARLTGWSCNTIRKMCAAGRLEHIRSTGIRGHIRIARSSLPAQH